MYDKRIEFISAYCDRWCERCPFTDRCSAYACHVAAAMCGDFGEGLELAVGAPQPESGERPPTIGEMLASGINVMPSPEELAVIERNEEARRERLDEHPLKSMCIAYAVQSTTWLDGRREGFDAGDAVLREAVDVVAWDAHLIGAKVSRALDGQDRALHDEDEDDDDPVQNDWNGSAKVAMISVRRSAEAWVLISHATADSLSAALAADLQDLERRLLEQFPRAMAFVRPGFDEPSEWRST